MSGRRIGSSSTHCFASMANLNTQSWGYKSIILGSMRSFKLDMLKESGEFLRAASIMDASERLSGVFVDVPSVRIMASFPVMTSKTTTPNAYTSLLVVARPSLKYSGAR